MKMYIVTSNRIGESVGGRGEPTLVSGKESGQQDEKGVCDGWKLREAGW